MGKNCLITAPAKINLHLEILGKRQDGYHDIRSLFLMLSLADRLILTVGGKKLMSVIQGCNDCAPENNTITKAIQLFRRETGIDEGIMVGVEKNIPSGGGLGGGSSDAAGTLMLLNHFFGSPLSGERLCELGAMIGSDVPFFLSVPLALVEGRGERVTPCDGVFDYSILIVVPTFTVNTADAYRLYDEQTGERRNTTGMSADELIKAVTRTPPSSWRFFNSFKPVLAQRYPVYDELHEMLITFGALFAGLSGSGSAYFGIFKNSEAADRSARELVGRNMFTRVVTSLRHLPAVEENCLSPIAKVQKKL